MSKVDSIDEIIAKVELSAEIARIALACPSCQGSVRKLIHKRRAHQVGGQSTDSNRLTEEAIKIDSYNKII
jgi:hypothetical protein